MSPAKGAGAGSVTHTAVIRVEPDPVPGQPILDRTRTAIRCGHPQCGFPVATIVQGTVDDDGSVIEMRPVDGDGVLDAFLSELEQEARGHPADGVPGQRWHMVIWIPGMRGAWKEVAGAPHFVVTPSGRLQREIARRTPGEIERLQREAWERDYRDGMEMAGREQSGYAAHGSPELDQWARRRADDLQALSGPSSEWIQARRPRPHAGKPPPGVAPGVWAKRMPEGEESLITRAFFRCPKALHTPHFNVLAFEEACNADCKYHGHA